MASFRLQFPEKEEPSLILLTGERITVGRLPNNTIQIVDRTISSKHAELVLDEGHYRLRDVGSTNGTFVNGEQVTDFHLREACIVSFGMVECAFDPAAAEQTAEGAELLPTRAELTALKGENEDLKTQVSALRGELDAFRQVHPAAGDDPAAAVPKTDYEKVVVDREALEEAQQRFQQEIAKLKEKVAVLQRDRDNLQRALNATQGKAGATPAVAAAPAPGEAAAAPAPPPPPPAAIAPKPTAMKAVPVAKPPMARPIASSSTNPAAGTDATPPVLPTPRVGVPMPVAKPVAKAVAIPGNNPNLKPLAKAPIAMPRVGGKTQKLDPASLPKVLPKPDVKLGANRPAPLVSPRAVPAPRREP